MSSEAKDHVHLLIHAMSRAEKRYFKLFVKRNGGKGGSVHERLFDVIAAMPEHDEERLRSKFAGQAFMKRFAITKRRLYETVLRSLESFHADNSVDFRLRHMLNQVELLHQRALYEEARRMLRSAQRLARKHDRQAVLMEVLQQERRLVEDTNYAGVTPEGLDELRQRSEGLRDELAELEALWDVKSRLFIDLYRRGKVRDEQGRKAMDKLLGAPVLRDRRALRSTRARFLFNHVHSAAAYAMGDLEACYQALSANRDLMNAERTHFSDEPNLVFPVLSNLIYVSVQTGRYEEAGRLLKEFRRMPADRDMPETEDLELKLFSTSMSLELSMHCRMGAFDKALELLPAVERGLARHGARLSALRLAGFDHQLAYACFGAGRLTEAQHWCHRLLNESRMDQSEELIRYGTLLNLVLKLETQGPDMLPHAIRSAERLLQGQQRNKGAEALLLAAVREVARGRTPQAESLAYAAFLEKARPLEHDPEAQALFEHFDAIAWAESRLNGRPFADVVKERAMRVGRAA